MDNYLEKINENLLIIRKNSRLFILFGLLGIFIAIAAHNLIQNRYEAETHLQINYPILDNQKNEKETSSEIKILILQARSQIFYTEEIQKNCNVSSYEKFSNRLKISEVRGISSAIKINYVNNNIDYSKKCLKEVVIRLDEIIKTKANKTKEDLYLKNQIIEKNIHELTKKFEKNNEIISHLTMPYFKNLSLIYEEYIINKKNIEEFSKKSYVNQLSNIESHSKPIYGSALILYSIVIAISLISAFCLSYLKEIKIIK